MCPISRDSGGQYNGQKNRMDVGGDAFFHGRFISWAPVQAEQRQTLRCGVDFAQAGETQPQVLHKCGEPDAMASYPSYYGVEKWTYNRGPNDFVYNFTFIDGRLDHINQLGRGF